MPLWRLPILASPQGEPLFAGEVIYCADLAGRLYAVKASSGEGLSQYESGGTLRSTLLARGPRVYAVARSGLLLAIDFPHGKDPVEAWRFTFPGTSGRLAGDDHLLYFGNSEGILYALKDAGEGCEVTWQVTLDQPISAAPVPWRHLLLVATRHHQGQVIAIETRGRQEAWRRPLGGRGAYLLLARGGSNDPTGAAVITVTDQGRVSAYSLPEGDPLGWSYLVQGGLVAAPVVAGQIVYLGGGDGQVTALNVFKGETRPLGTLGGCVVGLASWRGLLFAAVQPGEVVALDAASGEQVWRWQVPGGLATRSGLTAGGGLALVGSGTEGWLALPWHMRDFKQAAHRCRAWGDMEGAAAFAALSGDASAAEAAWYEAGQPEKAARMWAGVGEDERAGRAFCKAAEAQRLPYPALAAAHYHRAADHFEMSERNEQEAKDCRQRAGRMGRFPYLKIEIFNNSLTEAGLPGTVGVAVRNIGNSPAHQVRFRIGGRLAHLVRGDLQQPLLPGSQAELEFQELIPIAVGRYPLRILLTYSDESGALLQAETSPELDISPPPPGTISVEKDGVIWVRVPEGAPLPSVRVKGDAIINYKVTRDDEKPGFVWPELKPGFASDDLDVIQHSQAAGDENTIPVGHWAFFLKDGRVLDRFEPGRHTRQAVPALRAGLLPGAYRPKWEAIQFRATDIRLAFRLGPFPARDRPQVGMEIGLTIAFEAEKAFDPWLQAGQGRALMTASDLQQWLTQEVSGIASSWISHRTREELSDGFALRDKLALTLEEELKDTLAGHGLRLVGRLWALNFIIPPA